MKKAEENPIVPKEFHENNNRKMARVESIAFLAYESLKAKLKLLKITEDVFVAETKIVDVPDHKGIAYSTIHSNEKVHELIDSLRKEQIQNVKKTKRKRPSRSKRSNAKALRDKYSNRTKLELMEKVEEKDREISELQKLLSTYREEMKILRIQNNNQLILLTRLQEEGNEQNPR